MQDVTLASQRRPEDMKRWIVEYVPAGEAVLAHAGDFDFLSLAQSKRDELVLMQPAPVVAVVRRNPCR